MQVIRHFRKFIVGYDFSGVVKSVGTGVACKSLKAGDEVFGLSFTGSIAEYATVNCEHAIHKPAVLTFAQAAGLPVAALTSLQAYDRAKLNKGRVLVIGASGGAFYPAVFFALA